jgi:hypothetical protein
MVNCILKSLIHGSEKLMLDLTYACMVIENTVKFNCFYDGRRESLGNMYKVSLADRSSR